MKENAWLHLNTLCFVIRFVALFLSAFYFQYATGHYKLISSNIELHNGTYDTAILTGEKLADRWGSVLFFWNIIIWWPSMGFLPPLNLPLAIVDTIMTVFISMATHYQIGYTPHSKKACQDPVNLESQRPPGTNESFFAAAGRLNATAASPTKMCLEFVEEMQYGITLSFFYAVIAFVGYMACFGAARQMRRNNESILDLIKEAGSYASSWLYCPVKWAAIVVWGVLFFAPILFFRYLPLGFKAPVRSGRRYVVKAAVGAEQKVEVMMSELKNGLSRREDAVEPYRNSGGTHTQLAQFLEVYDMLVIVAKHLHYTDVLSLSNVSKSVREAVLPSNEVSRRLTTFRLYTCEPDEKTNCWSCTTQVCSSCQVDLPVPQSIASQHMEDCVPYCASCYQVAIVRHARARKNRSKGNPPCNHAQPSQQRKTLRLFLRKNKYYAHAVSSWSIDRQICRNCSQFAREELSVRKAKSTVMMLKKGLKSNGDKWEKCANRGCGRSLETGPRYWIHEAYSCYKECPSTLHQAWGSKADDGIGGEALV